MKTLDNKIRFGIIGCSSIASSSTIPAILASSYSELAYIGSRSKKKAEEFSNKFGCKNFGTYDDVLSADVVDAVYISLPVGLHEHWSVKAAKAGKHILCEKSSTNSYKSAKNMVAESLENRVRLMEGFMFRFHPSHRKVKQFIESGVLGKIFSFYGVYGFPSISHDDIRYKKDLGGGILNDVSCYPICASRIIFQKEPIGVMSDFTIDEETKVDEKAEIFLKYDQDQCALMQTGYGLAYQSEYRLWGTKGNLSLSRAYNIPPDMEANLTLDSSKDKTKISIPPANHFQLMIDSFCQEIIQNGIIGFNLEQDLLKQAQIMEAVRKSHQEQSYIEVSSIQ